MQLIVRDSGELTTLEVEPGKTILQALRLAGIRINAPCGGAGTCLKCQVLVTDDEGVSYRLACKTLVTDGMEVTIHHLGEMSVVVESQVITWPADGPAGKYAFAVDIGTTTVAIRLHDCGTGEILGAHGFSNPQSAFGADVLRRISAANEENIALMASLLGDMLVMAAKRLMEAHNVTPDQIAGTVMCGNTTMQHLAMGLDPSSIGVYPFEPSTRFGDVRPYEPFVKEGINGSGTFMVPCVAAYVGGDITAGILDTKLLSAERPTFLLDLGTNGEMALGNKDGIITCATAAGPVFEGADIKYGMPAYPGAITDVDEGDKPGELVLSVVSGHDPIGVCGTGLISAVALLIRRGLLDETGRILDDDEIDYELAGGFEKLLIEEDGARAFRLTDRIAITQHDIRNLQLAKAAVCAGMITLMEEAHVQFEDIGDLFIAGGFGKYLDFNAAATIGLFPLELLDRAQSVGDTALGGASALVVSGQAWKEILAIVENTSYIELSTSANFNHLYVSQIEFV